MAEKNEQVAEYRQTQKCSLSELVKELERQKDAKVDFVADTRGVRVMVDQAGKLRLVPQDSRAGEWLPKDGAPIKPTALTQFGSKAEPEVPSQFMARLAAARPQRAAELLNGLMADSPARRFVRVLDGQVRAFLSDRYRVLDNFDIAFAALDAVRASGGEVIEAALSDTSMRLKFTSRAIWDAIELKQRGDKGNWYAGGLGNQEHLQRVNARTGGDLPGGPGTIHPLITVHNSETGHGGFAVRFGIVQAICFNLATVEEMVGKVHLGERLSVGIYAEETISQESKAIYMKARDAVRAAFNPEHFKRIVAMAQKAQGEQVTAPTAAAENVAKAAGLSDKSKDVLLGFFIRDYDQTRYGMAQAVARLAQEEPEAEKTAELEDLAGKLLRGEVALAAA